MTLNLTSRRTVAGRFPLLAVAALCLLLPCAYAAAQHGGGRGGRPIGSGGLLGERSGNRNSGGFDRPQSESRGQPRTGLQLGLSGRWWDDHHTAHKLNLTSDQQRRMDTIFESNWPTVTNLYANLQRHEINMASLSPSDLKDETKVFASIDRVSQARGDLEKEYAHMFLQIRQQLDPQQLDALDRQIASSH